MAITPVRPDTSELCGTFTDPTVADPGRGFSAPIVLSCEAPDVDAAEELALVWVDGVPFFEEASATDTGTGLSYAEFNYTGEIADEQIFGGFSAPAALRVLGMQITAETVPDGDDIQICLVDVDDVEISGTTGVLTDGETFEATTFDTATTLLAGDVVKAKVKQIGSSTPGGYLNVRLVLGPAT